VRLSFALPKSILHFVQLHDPLTARAEVVHRIGLRRGNWAVTVESRTSLSVTREAFELRARLEAFEGDTLVRARSWNCLVAREGVWVGARAFKLVLLTTENPCGSRCSHRRCVDGAHAGEPKRQGALPPVG